MPSAHGDFTIDHDRICGIDDPVNDRIRDRAVIVRISVDAVVPPLGTSAAALRHVSDSAASAGQQTEGPFR